MCRYDVLWHTLGPICVCFVLSDAADTPRIWPLLDPIQLAQRPEWTLGPFLDPHFLVPLAALLARWQRACLPLHLCGQRSRRNPGLCLLSEKWSPRETAFDALLISWVSFGALVAQVATQTTGIPFAALCSHRDRDFICSWTSLSTERAWSLVQVTVYVAFAKPMATQ
jgi:hypothetical protein